MKMALDQYMKAMLIAVFLFMGITAHAQTPEKTRILIIFDASGSMTTPIEKWTRIQVAKRMAT